MCLHFRSTSLALACGLLCGAASARAEQPLPLRICADPDNLPFSNRATQGFDNRIAEMVARDLHRTPVFIWTRSRRGFMREQFNKGACDLLMGVPAGMRAIATTQPYYKSSYVFVTRAAEHLAITSFTDPHLDGRRIGLQILEEDMSPPSLPLIRSGHAAGLVGFESFGNEAGDIIRAVAMQSVNVAVVWGPVAGFFAASQHFPVALHAVSPAVDPSGIPFVYAITMGVHKRDNALRDAVNASLLRLQPQITRVLAAYHVPTLPMQRGGA